MEITVNVESVDLDTVIGEKRTYDEDRDQYGSEPMTIGDAVVERLYKHLLGDTREIKQRVSQIRDEVIRERVAIEVEAALTEPFQPVNQYGEKRGPETTLREIIAKIAQEAVRIDNRNSWSREDTAATKVIREEVNRALDKELKETVAEEKAKVVKALREKAAELLAGTLEAGLRR